jgi:hypothetical protein
MFKKIKEELFMVSKVERDAKMEGRRMTLVLQPDHKNPALVKPPTASAGAPALSRKWPQGSSLRLRWRRAAR